MFEQTPLNIQMKIISQLTRVCVTTAFYLKCNSTASKRSTPIAVTVRKDVLLKKVDRMLKATQRVRDVDEVRTYIRTSKDAINRGCAIKPTAKSETVKLDSRIRAGECKENDFQIAIITAKFANSAIRQRKKFTTQIAHCVVEFLFGISVVVVKVLHATIV